jgi:hypothetical protein
LPYSHLLSLTLRTPFPPGVTLKQQRAGASIYREGRE